ncbi:30S ribosomal protein S3 [Methanococcoides methylutens]|uniref:Small ribosomal subunit protein uS3 n=1 Tax=Methanococcoides methylutens MM1 TaxID=1434104 RepID=A0A0E3WZA3_METMT|nr:30S ribosomal protein S3 [Methanococcoides methylutens]AKB84644.1 SSU ribosomal protein S3e (S3p) [Methanococcoides methylutens MM1]
MAVEKKFVQDGFVKASMDEYFAKQLSRAGYGGMDINRTPMGTQITIYAEKPGMVIGKAGKVIRKLTRDVDRIYDLDNPQIDAQEVKKPELNAQMMASRLASSIERGWYFRKAGHNTMRAIMNAGALGCEIVISGKLTGARSRVEKMVSGYIKHAGKPAEDIVDDGFAVAVKKLGTLGCRVRIIHPNAVLPDAYRMKTAEELAASGVVAPAEEAKAGIEELVEAEGAVAEPEEVVEAAPEVTEVAEETAEAEVVAEEPMTETTAESEAVVEIVEGEERREVNGVWQHKHEGHDYWHPMARVHREG